MIIANEASSDELAIYHLISNAHSWNNSIYSPRGAETSLDDHSRAKVSDSLNVSLRGKNQRLVLRLAFIYLHFKFDEFLVSFSVFNRLYFSPLFFRKIFETERFAFRAASYMSVKTT